MQNKHSEAEAPFTGVRHSFAKEVKHLTVAGAANEQGLRAR